MLRILVLAGALAAVLPTIRLSEGRSTELSLGFHPIQIICDDLSIVSVTEKDGTIMLKGLSPGRTTCSFVNVAFQREIVDVEVTRR